MVNAKIVDHIRLHGTVTLETVIKSNVVKTKKFWQILRALTVESINKRPRTKENAKILSARSPKKSWRMEAAKTAQRTSDRKTNINATFFNAAIVR